MPRPVLAPDPGPTLDRLYDRLPDHYRDADEATDYTLYRWLAGVLSQMGELQTMVAGIDYQAPAAGQPDTDTSTLVDPVAAPAAWLPWLAQLVGASASKLVSDAERRDSIRFASAGWRAGTKTAVADAAKSALTGTRYARVYDHTVSVVGDGGMWDVLVVTRSSETASSPAVLDAVLRRGAKPAGVQLRHRTFEASWDAFSTAYPTWDTIEAAKTWQKLEEAGL